MDALETDEVGYLVADGVKTSIPVSAAGDVADRIYRHCYGSNGCANIRSYSIF